jgi:citrate lyase subunit alpha/citrate CoA-transferase
VVKDKVTTLCGPGELIDVVVTERGIAINPRRTDLLELTKGSGLPIKSMEELKSEADRICGIPDPPELTNRVVAAIKWVDGTLIDVVKQVSKS